MNLNDYQRQAGETQLDTAVTMSYLALGLCGEAGEVAEKVKKRLRDGDRGPSEEAVALELGDVLWYLSRLAAALGYDLDSVAEANLDKLAARAAHGRLQGSGDQR